MDFRRKLRLLSVALLMMAGVCAKISFGQISFDRVIVDANGPKDPFGKTAGDIDGDGYADLVEGGLTSGGLVWYKNPKNPVPSWRKYTIKEGAGFGTEHEIADIDNDGKPDLVVIQKGSFVWLENDGTPEDGGWKETLISETELHDIEVGDFDGDGDMDIIGRNQSEWGNDGNILNFYEQITPDKWARSTRGCLHGEGLLAVDMDGDGKKDAVTGNRWYKNPGKMNAAEWKEYTISSSWEEGNVFIGEGDLSGDGLVDLVLVPSERVHESCRISWFEQPRDLYGGWIEHVLEDSVQSDYHFVGCADFNLDGKTDIVMAEMHHGDNPDEVVVYENKKKGKKWTKNIIWEGGSHSCRIFDCDNDGDPDFFGSNYLGTEVNLWVNRAVMPTPRKGRRYGHGSGVTSGKVERYDFGGQRER